MVMNGNAPTKEKRRASDKRREKSRDAARCRRSRESEIFSNLAAVLPLPNAIVTHLDKASIMRLIITNLRIMKIFEKLHEKKIIKTGKCDDLYLEAVGGFVLVLALDGDIVFISSNVASYLGIPQVDLLGQSIYEVTHPCDHGDIKEVLSIKNDCTDHTSFFLRMKCTLSSKSRSINIKSASYKVLRVTGHFIDIEGSLNDKYSFVSIAAPIPHPSEIDAPLGSFIFLSKHSLDMKFTFADEKITSFLGYNPESLIGKSMYQYHHGQDNANIEKAFKSLFSRGQSETGMYRFLAQGGGFVWVATQATIIYCDKGTKPQSVVCVHYVISENSNENEVYSNEQLEYTQIKEKAKPLPRIQLPKIPKVAEKFSVPPKIKTEQRPSFSRPQSATAKIFAPKTADMNKGFLTFSEDETHTFFKDEPEDLTHLAPTAGDVCVPLDSMMCYDMFSSISFDEDNYCPLINTDTKAPLFSSYKDDCSRSSLSPSNTGSPSKSSVPSSLCSLDVDSPTFEESNVKSLLGLDLLDSDTDDTSGKSSYHIPLNEVDDVPPLMPFDLVWNINFASSSSNNSSSRCSPIPPEISSDSNVSSLQQLLQDDSINVKTSTTVPSDYFLLKTAELCEPDNRKRIFPLEQEDVKKRKHQNLVDSNTSIVTGDSVLRNLLVVGHDINAGYICSVKTPTQSDLQAENS